MTDIPDHPRIWLEPRPADYGDDSDPRGWCETGDYWGGGTEYIRADLAVAKDAKIARLRAALVTCLSTLTDDRIGNCSYMEGSAIYDDLDRAARAAREALA